MQVVEVLCDVKAKEVNANWWAVLSITSLTCCLLLCLLGRVLGVILCSCITLISFYLFDVNLADRL